MSLVLRNLQRAVPLRRAPLRRAVELVRGVLGVQKFDLAVICVDNKNIQHINKTYREKNVPTDVLSFPYHENLKAGEMPQPHFPDDYNLGDIFLGVEYIFQQCKENEDYYDLLTVNQASLPAGSSCMLAPPSRARNSPPASSSAMSPSTSSPCPEEQCPLPPHRGVLVFTFLDKAPGYLLPPNPTLCPAGSHPGATCSQALRRPRGGPSLPAGVRELSLPPGLVMVSPSGSFLIVLTGDCHPRALSPAGLHTWHGG